MWAGQHGGGGALLQFLPGRAHGRYLLAGQGLEGLRYQVRVRHHHLLPARRLHHVRHVPRVDELNCLQIIGIKMFSNPVLNMLPSLYLT